LLLIDVEIEVHAFEETFLKYALREA